MFAIAYSRILVSNTQAALQTRTRWGGITYASLKEFDDASADIETEIKKNRKNAGAWYAKGNLELSQKKYADAATSFEFSATIDPIDSSWYMAAFSYYANNNFSKAIETSNKASNLNPKMQRAYRLCANAYYNKKQYSDAVKEFEKTIKAGSSDDELIFTYASALEYSGDFLKASQNFDFLSKSEIYKDTVILRSGICFAKTRNPENFLPALSKFNRYTIYKNHSDNSEAFAWTAYCYMLMDSIILADEFIDKAQKANGNNSMLEYVYACKSAMSNNYGETFLFLEKSLIDINLTKSYVENEPLFDELKKNQATKERFSQLLDNIFKQK